MANRVLLLGLDATDPPSEYEPPDGLLGANYSVPILWLSLFSAADLVQWPSALDPTTYTALIGPRELCRARSRDRLSQWVARWPELGTIANLWLELIRTASCAFLGVWTEEISDMSGDDDWAATLRSYLGGLDDLDSADFREALAQSYLGVDASGHLSPTEEGSLGLLAGGYAWSHPAPWD